MKHVKGPNIQLKYTFEFNKNQKNIYCNIIGERNTLWSIGTITTY